MRGLQARLLLLLLDTKVSSLVAENAGSSFTPTKLLPPHHHHQSYDARWDRHFCLACNAEEKQRALAAAEEEKARKLEARADLCARMREFGRSFSVPAASAAHGPPSLLHHPSFDHS